ncbi:glutamate--tRNA ligase [Actinomarinicola tropica]|uniref:Glutamate--tRNA ligase n=1 Tax=Actinomarinicola tropica TaxID=2789776 RepID=A0A5Q2RJG1_9ACTN|nr:glutamate--tRNA ligase [Actinomarinicola tropica]QGG94701.1 glutamate--tRNA ligase [Actinomarinicola tropica]
MTTPTSDPSATRVRFSPAPTGYLHVGSARSALFNWLYARHTGGTFIVRVEDTDTDRSTPELTEAIFDALRTLGLDWDETYHQSDRFDVYRQAAERFLAEGRAYRCDCTQEAVKARAEARGGPPGYDGHCRDRDVQPGEGVVIRFRTPDEGVVGWDDVIRDRVEFENAHLEDFVIVRSNGVPMFLLANAIDDIEMGITHVVRGEDLVNTTPKVLLLREALGATVHPVYAHLPLIVNEQRKKLSKRRDDVNVADYLSRGILPEAMLNYLATLGWGAPDGVEIRPLTEVVELFDLADIGKSPAMFDVKKLSHFNGEYIRALPVEEFVRRAEPWTSGADVPWPPERFDPAAFASLAPLVQERVVTLDEVPALVDWLFCPDTPEDEASWSKEMGKAHAAAVLDSALVGVDGAGEWDADAVRAIVEQAARDAGLVGAEGNPQLAKAQAPVRVATLGRSKGLPLFESLELLGRDETRRRLAAARGRL